LLVAILGVILAVVLPTVAQPAPSALTEYPTRPLDHSAMFHRCSYTRCRAADHEGQRRSESFDRRPKPA
jgi:hypothetical protein